MAKTPEEKEAQRIERKKSDRHAAIFAVIVMIGIFVLAIFGAFVDFYNRTVDKEESINASIGQVQNYYQRRMDLIPNLVAVVKGAAAYEKSTLTAVIEARAKAMEVKISASDLSPEKLAKFEENQMNLSSALSKLLVVVESYPELKANKNFLDLQSQLVETENGIAKIRGNYHVAVKDYNSRIRGFPGMVFAKYSGWKTYPYFQADLEAQKAPKVNLNDSRLREYNRDH